VNENDDLTIEPLCLTDLPWVLGLEACSFRRPWTDDNFRQELASDFVVGLVGRDAAGEPVGYALGRLLFEEGHLLKIAVRPDARRRGVGARLLAAFEAALVRGGASVAVLEVRVGNAPARWLYERSGWGLVSLRTRYYPDGEDGLLMLKRLA
jgi:ribosomal-protein-alanine N-acetyltransferase